LRNTPRAFFDFRDLTYFVASMQPCMVSITISVCMFYSSIPSPPSLSLSSPYSKNAGAEFVSKIDLAMQYTSMYMMYTQLQCVQVTDYTVQTNHAMAKCQTFAMHTLVVYIKCTLMYCCDFFLPSWSTSAQSLAKQTQPLSNKHHVSFITT
jgi:hypothetical protein